MRIAAMGNVMALGPSDAGPLSADAGIGVELDVRLARSD